MAGAILEQGQDRAKIRLFRDGRGGCRIARRSAFAQFGQGRGNVGHARDPVDQPGGDRGLRHAGKFGFFGCLCDHAAAGFVQRLQRRAAVAARARQDHRNGARAARLRHRSQQEIERQSHAMAQIGRSQVQQPGSHRKEPARGDDIDVIGQQRSALGRFDHRHRGVFPQQIGHQAFVRGIKMLDHDKGHAGLCRNRLEQPRNRLQATGRCPDGNNRPNCGHGVCKHYQGLFATTGWRGT